MGGRIQGVLGNAVSSEAEDWSGHSLQHQQPGKGPAMEMNCLSPALRINQTISLEDSGTNSLRGERSSVDLDTRSNVLSTADPKGFSFPSFRWPPPTTGKIMVWSIKKLYISIET